MKATTPRNSHLWLIILAGSAILLVFIAVLLTTYTENEIEKQIIGFHGKATSVSVNLFTRSLQIKSLELGNGSDSINSFHHVLQLHAVTFTGLNLLALLRHKRIQVDEVIIDSGKVHYNSSIKPDGKKPQPAYNIFAFKSISLNNIHLQVKADTLVSFSAVLTGRITDALIQIDSVNELAYTVRTVDALVEEISLSQEEGMYGGTIARLYIDTEAQKVIIDSALLIPNFSKYAFAKVFDKQTDRISIAVPKAILEGVQFARLTDSALVIAKVQANSFELFSFRDKRVPFMRIRNMPLPMAGFLKLPWRVQIDSVQITNGRVHIEEFPETGNESGTLIFSSIDATLTGLNNRPNESTKGKAVLVATGLLMGAGKIHMVSQLPLDGSSPYHTQGSISNMNLANLDPVLTPWADIQIKSGHLKMVTMNFTYTELTSKGTLDIDYEDLRITVLNKNKESKNELKSLLINTLVKTNRNQSQSSSKRTGTIDIERDRRRSIFNLWAKSVLDGLKSGLLRSSRSPNANKNKN
jgi:hypothetical protein